MDGRRIQRELQRKASDLFSDLGDLYTIDAVDGQTKRVYEFLQQQCEGVIYKNMRSLAFKHKIAFGIIASGDVRAFATKRDDTYLVGVNAGTIHYLFNLCQAIMSSPFSFPFLKRSANKVDVDLDPRNVSIYSPIAAPIVSDNPEIEILTKNLFSYCVGFILKHELAHIFIGHLDRYRAVGGRELVDSPLGLLNQGLSGLEAQAMEFAADGASYTTYIQFAIRRALSAPKWPIEDWFIEGNTEVPMGPFASYVVFKALAPIEVPYSREKSSHPPTYMRARFLQLITEVALRKTQVSIDDAVRDFIVSPVRWAFDAYNDISGVRDRNFDDLMQGDYCLAATQQLKATAELYMKTLWRDNMLVQPEISYGLSFGSGN